jgi:hypothetical protein
MKSILLLACMPVLFLLGCASTETTQPASSATSGAVQRSSPSKSAASDRAIRSVSVAKDVALPAYPQVIGPSANTGALFFGPTAIAVMSQHENSDATRFKIYLEQNRIDPRETVRQAFLARLAASKTFAAIVPEGADATFELAIESYGLGAGFSMRPIDKPLKPMLRLSAKLSAPNGRVLWENTGYITNMGSGTPSYRFDDYFADASRTQDAFKKAAEIVVKEVLESIGTAGQ